MAGEATVRSPTSNSRDTWNKRVIVEVSIEFMTWTAIRVTSDVVITKFTAKMV